MKLIALLAVLFSMSAFANSGFDCRTGDDSQGGKFCHYTVSQCEQTDCVMAAECAIKKYSNAITWSKIKSVKLVSVNFKESSIKFDVQMKDKWEVQEVTLEQDEDSCNPVALKAY